MNTDDLDRLPHEMFEHYQIIQESARLSAGAGELERIRTQDILKRYLPPPPAVILDVGGAAGVHALWLANEGYAVHLIDPVPRHIEEAEQASKKQPANPISSCRIGDARKLDRPDQSVDALLLFGPLYHLTDRSERIQALKEAHRVLKPGGRIFAATVSRFASLLDGLSRDLVKDPRFVKILKQDLIDGQHRNPVGDPNYFTTAFFHHPENLRQELMDAGFAVERLIGVEGPAWFLSNFLSHWEHPEKRALLLDLLRSVEEDPCLLGASAHPMGIARSTETNSSERRIL